ncbi:MAG: hypothetical protein WCK29_02335 [archaeon]
MTNERIVEQRKRLNSLLGVIVENYKLIGKEMESESHPRGTTHRSLNPKSGDFIVEGQKGITSFYTHSDGVTYQINIHQR